MGSLNHFSLVSNTGSSDSRNDEQRQGLNGSANNLNPDGSSLGTGEFAAADTNVSVLANAIQNEIIPRLMLAHRTPVECEASYDSEADGISPADVVDFVSVLLKGVEADTIRWIENARRRGGSVEDLCDFTDVTIGLGELHKILHLLHDGHDRNQYPASNGLSVLLMPSPGEQHTLGLTMVADFFQRAGWEVAGGPYAPSDDPAILVRKRRYDAIGFSLATSLGFNRLKDCITAVRAAAAPSPVCIIVGGPFFTAHPERVNDVGADLVVHDARSAPGLAQLHIAGGSMNQKASLFKH
jgi:methylmalonyl-CoA mutase cobalamin-binding subunit